MGDLRTVNSKKTLAWTTTKREHICCMTCLAAIDIGSNAIRMVVGSLDKKGGVKVLKKFREPLRLGRDVFRSRRLSEAMIGKLVESIEDLKLISDSFGAKQLRVVATSALRESINKTEIIERVLSFTNVPIEVIDYKEEAILISSVVRKKVDISKDASLIFDIGGGSVEFIILQDGKVSDVTSFPAGTVRILNRIQSNDDFVGIERCVDDLERQLVDWLGGKQRKFKYLIGTGGNIECLGDLRQSVLGKKSDQFIRSEELESLVGKVKDLSYEQRKLELNLRADRADVLVPAMMISRMVFRVAQKGKLQIPRVGLRDGILLSLSESARYQK
jgi:exopolyphosphatase/guanosine-5'-triphosphate,3'-diphosphate pyrophosphatase